MPVLSGRFAADDTTVDDTTTLFAGKGEVTGPVLTQELSDSDEEEFFVDDATGAPGNGFAAIDDEIIQYGQRLGITNVRYLQRGIEGTIPAIHLVGASVKLTPAFYISPEIPLAIIALQNYVIAQKAIADDHETRLAALEP